MGIATDNTLDRTMASYGKLKGMSPKFDTHNSVEFGGVLMLLPALLQQGLMKIKETHKIKEGYYSLENIILTLAFMALCRIKNPQQLQLYKAGEMGKLLGYDRITEMKCLRNKMQELFENKSTATLNSLLAKEWMGESEELLFYADGHVKIYNGSKANLTKKFVSRQKLCLAGTTDFWLNDISGMPMMMWTGELNEKLQYMIEYEIIPKLLSANIIKTATEHTTEPVCTIIFDREAYEPDFFIRLWIKYKIAIISYRKFVKDKWEETDFTKYNATDHHGNPITQRKVDAKGRQLYKLDEAGARHRVIPFHLGCFCFSVNEVKIENIALFTKWLDIKSPIILFVFRLSA
jgi:hypothetical protein